MTSSDSGSPLVPILLIIVLTLLNAIFSAAEMAVVSVSDARIKTLIEDGHKKAKILQNLQKDQTQFLSTIQVGITFAGFLSSAAASSTIATSFGDFLKASGIPQGQTIAVIVTTIIISYISLVFGELVPKRIALQNSEAVALKLSGFLNFTSKIFGAFAKFLSLSTTAVLKLIGLYSEDIEEKISEEELKSYISVGQEQGVINKSGKDMMINIFEFDDSCAYEIMTPRTDLFMISVDEFSRDTIDEILAAGHSRIPVYEENRDDIIGLLYIKDLFRALHENNNDILDIRPLLKEPFFIPESKKIDRLLYDLKASRNYMAILVDEYGGISGMVTIEDIVEEIVGEIEDEYDNNVEVFEKVSEDTYLIDGNVELKAINNELGTKLDSENNETIGGYAIELLGFFPEEITDKTFITYDENYMISILKVEDNRVTRVMLTILPEPEDEEEPKED